ncbi:solute:sodium symporter family transporter [Leeuwenhoekiella palythoae]|uniref:SSS family solute:Na+ symporter n=1 Tax=Leeuwenhoekiella palythoae TaxID=573501 RepID=A0A1M5TAH8_9FLAO|nr:solute:sodium symporter family transporter [Leeuwenhoekiella palythoae]MEC7785081.1 solute:sodium symporter family transporter [Bacteroidota bacterium]MEE3146787.1 solute:sodium symporter family transporter [Bacteroidota bacterium]RXG28722.1 SSS family solute:Na+ symporter [Leeuwenhoekiella palythoae]UBZ09893.1 solute:sodium symporter family transporter [Leeuwenhoekiella palythoae]SHH47739.1 solute:Na+ symporter, SSS family [Leeuwenhoekiella palythoae]
MGLITFAAFTLLVAVISYFASRKTDETTSDGYFLGGRSLTGPVIAGSLLLTNLSTEQIIGTNGVGFSEGILIAAYEIVAAVAMVFTAFVLLPKYLKGGISTIPQFLEKRYGKLTKTIVSILFLMAYAISMLPTVLYSGALAINTMFDIPERMGLDPEAALWVTVWGIGLIGSIYAIFGGLKAVAVSDSINAVGLIVGGLLIPVFGLMAVGNGSVFEGLNVVTTNLPEKFEILGGPNSSVPWTTLFTGMLIVNFYYWGTNQAIIQRALGAKNLAEGQKGLCLAAIVKILGPIIVVLPGVIAFEYFNGNLDNADEAYPMLVKAVLPTAFVGFFAAVLFGAILSSFNSALNSSVTLFGLDLYKQYFNNNASEKQVVRAGKTFGIFLAIFSMALAPLLYGVEGGIFNYLQELNGSFSVPILAIILVGYFSKRVSGKAANIAIVFAVVTYLVTLYVVKPIIAGNAVAAAELSGVTDASELAMVAKDAFPSFLHIMGIIFVLVLIILFTVSKFFPRQTDYLEEYTRQVDITPWKYLKPAGVVICIAVVSIYVYFS